MAEVDVTAEGALGEERAWWRLRPDQVRRRLSELGVSGLVPGLYDLGFVWDGRSAIQMEAVKVGPRRIRKLLNELRTGLVGARLPLVRLPDETSVRCCPAEEPFSPDDAVLGDLLVVDLEFEDFILPVAVHEKFLRRSSGFPIEATVEDMLWRARIAREEEEDEAGRAREIRGAVERIIAEVGHGLTPIWLRLKPSVCYEYICQPNAMAYDMMLLHLDGALQQAIDCSRLECVADVERELGWLRTSQPRCSLTARILRETGSPALISEVALAMIAERRMDPSDVVARLQASYDPYRGGELDFGGTPVREKLILQDGLVRAAIRFDGGEYRSGGLRLTCDAPASIVAGSKGRPLEQLVRHDAFIATGVTIDEVRIEASHAELLHAIWAVPLWHAASMGPTEALAALRARLAGHSATSGPAAECGWSLIGRQ